MSTGSTGLPKAKAPLEKGSRQLAPFVVPSGIIRNKGNLHVHVAHTYMQAATNVVPIELPACHICNLAACPGMHHQLPEQLTCNAWGTQQYITLGSQQGVGGDNIAIHEQGAPHLASALRSWIRDVTEPFMLLL